MCRLSVIHVIDGCNSTLYASYKKKNMSMAMTSLIKKITDKDVDPKESYILLEVMAADDKGEPIDLPIVRFKYKL